MATIRYVATSRYEYEDFASDEEQERRLEGVRGRRWLKVSGADLPFSISISLGIGADGRLACTGLIIGAAEGDVAEVTSASLRKVRIAEVLQELASAMEHPEIGRFAQILYGAMAEDLPAPRVRPGPGGLPPEHFEVVAREYRRALAVAPRAPIRELCRRMGAAQGHEVPEPTARRWVQRARDRGLLGPSTPGKAGEGITEQRS